MNISEGCILDNNKYFEKFLDNYCFNQGDKEEGYWINESSFEFIIRPECNQKCEYCYIARYGKDLYPLETRANNEKILKNMNIMLDYIFNERKVLFLEIELFAGDLFYDNLGFSIFDLLLKYYGALFEEHPNLFKNHHPRIAFPNNFSFVADDKKAAKVEEYLQKFLDLEMELNLSCSVDGPYDSVREENKDFEYYDKIMQFLSKNCCGIHPMISPNNIESAIKNYDWWLEQFEKYKLCKGPRDEFQPMFLEVRNDEWTEEKLNHYLEFLTHMLEIRFQMNDSSLDKLARHIFLGDGEEGSLIGLHNYDPLQPTVTWRDGNYTCAISHQTCLYVATMELVPCHRTSYQQFIGGKFEVENDKIIGITAINPSLYTVIKTNNTHLNVGCVTCPYDPFCLKLCLGAALEATGDLFLPPKSVCELHKTRISFLVKSYCELGLTKIALEKNYFPDEKYKENWLNLCHNLGYYND